MAAITAIDWTDATPNPITHRCTKIAPECANCYAETITNRWEGRGAFTSGAPRLKPHKLADPWRDKGMREAYRKFLASMSDPFHIRLSFDDQALLFAMMAADRASVYQVPTKRAAIMCRRLSSPDFERRAREHLGTLEQMARDARRITPWRQAMLEDIAAARAGWTWPLPNVWIGVSAGTRDTARRYIPWLVRAPAATRFLSCEPLLEELSLEQWLGASRRAAGTGLIHWVIAGGESGSGHRPLDLDHARALRDQCRRHGIPFWFKQVGGVTHNAGGDELDGRRWKQLPVPREGVLV